MCRLLAWVAAPAASAEEIVGRRELDEFTDLARLHPDGWGMAWWGDEASPQSTWSTRGAADDPDFAAAGTTIRSDAALVHLRWATPGMAVTPANCHPFIRGDMALAHNGGIYPLDRLDRILPPRWEEQVRGTTDSERYLLAVLAERQTSGKDTAAALTEVVAHLFGAWTPSSLNAICLTPDALLVVCAYNPHVPAPAGPESADQYYALRYRATDRGTVVASSGIAQPASEGWVRLPNMTVTAFHRTTGAVTQHPVPVAPEAAASSFDAGQAADVR